MKTIKRYMALAIVFLLIVAGVLLLMLDYDTTTMKWLTIIGAAISFAAGICLGKVFDRHNLLPE